MGGDDDLVVGLSPEPCTVLIRSSDKLNRIAGDRIKERNVGETPVSVDKYCMPYIKMTRINSKEACSFGIYIYIYIYNMDCTSIVMFFN